MNSEVMDLIKVMNHIKDMYDQEDTLILRQDEVVETLAQLEREGLPSDKQLKQLKKIGANLQQLKLDIVAKEKEIQPMVQKESEFYKKAIGDFENELKTYQGGLKKEAYYFYKSPSRPKEAHVACFRWLGARAEALTGRHHGPGQLRQAYGGPFPHRHELQLSRGPPASSL